MITPTIDIKELRKRFEYLKNCIHFEDKINQENELNMRMHDPAFWNDAKMAETISKDWKNLSKLLYDINLTDDNITYLELLSDEELSQEESKALYNTCLETISKYEMMTLEQSRSKAKNVMESLLKVYLSDNLFITVPTIPSPAMGFPDITVPATPDNIEPPTSKAIGIAFCATQA